VMPPWLQALGAIALLVSFVLLFLVFRENTFLSPMVRLQTERGQSVISSGPYAVVRHPMYASAGLLLIGTPLLLGSWFGLVYVLLLIALIGYRAVREENTLRDELPGYREYMQRVRYRLLPGVW